LDGEKEERMNKRFALLFGAMLLLGAQVGCGGNKDKGINRDKDKPKPAAKAEPGMPMLVVPMFGVPPSGGSAATA
jgi:hypothetical protein